MIRRPPRSTLSSSSAASDVYKRQVLQNATSPNSAILRIFSFQLQFAHIIRHTLLPCFLPLPFPLFPVTTMFLHANTQSLASLRSTCPNHLNLPWRTLSDTPTIPSLSLSTSLEFPSFRVTPHIHLIIIFSALTNRCMSSTFIAHVSLPYIITH